MALQKGVDTVAACSCCFLCQRAEAELVAVGRLRTTLTTRPLVAVLTTILALHLQDTNSLKGAEVICLKCSELLDQVTKLLHKCVHTTIIRG